MKIKLLIPLIIIFQLGCKDQPKSAPKESSGTEVNSWIHLDPQKDSIPGIGLNRVYKELISEGDGEEIIVAVMDKQINIYHEDLKEQIYTNPNEIANNGIDDDNNGYVDDINGWNFLGYGKYNYEKYLSYTHVRIIQKYAKKFTGKTLAEIDSLNINEFEQYQEALSAHAKIAAREKQYLNYSDEARNEYYNFIKTFSDRITGHQDFTMAQLDSLEVRNEEERELVEIMKRNVGWGYTFEYTYGDEENILIRQYTCNNINYQERHNIGDNPFDYETVGYGNGRVEAPSHVSHGTQVAGLIAATRNNGLNNIRIMPVVVSPEYGNYNDKDLANAIRYAADNGARIINFSGIKRSVENEPLLFSALKYAQNKGVLVITGAGNNGVDIDKPENKVFLSEKFGKNSVNNLIRVGGTTKNFGNRLLSAFSNYGGKNVDFFAPATEIETTDSRIIPYITTSGTSLATALTSSVAALIWSSYPNLNHIEVKDILMNSGTAFENLTVQTNSNDSIPFKNLSKAGKVLNAFNAMKMAKEISAKKD